MKKINFVNGTTIDGASTFNEMQNNVEEVFNGEEAMGSIVVEDIKCKNIFNINSLVSTDGAYFTINSSTKFTVTSTGTAYESGYVYSILDVNPNTNYTISGSNTGSIEIWSEDINEYINSTGGLPFTFNSGNHERIAILFRATNAQATSEFENIQVEKGTQASSYTPNKNFECKGVMKKLYDDTISTKGVFTLKDNVSNYDEIHVFATINTWGHQQICSILKHTLSSSFVQTIIFSKDYWDMGTKVYQNIIDTTGSTVLEGAEGAPTIWGIYGIRYGTNENPTSTQSASTMSLRPDTTEMEETE